ncbi:phosphonate C-P lyase system protein PhnG [Billgrantia lactosivorans]|uniref:phosphonate C-P lyase system protein PhnG n=1 Tax=Billgrantia lactosivorans TaxID=2185141 RepID=UPI000DAC3100|nr:phosphonate C-P lyase system protein PhnG [Halomonas lactosivorans]
MTHLHDPSRPRVRRQRVLALSSREQIETRWDTLGIRAAHRCVRGPETGMAMLRGRMGGTGRAFNLGEMTLTRASVVLDDEAPTAGALGHGWVRGRDHRHAELIALVDACAQHEAWARRIDSELIAPLEEALELSRALAAREAAATRVDFFTLVRGE